jgi:hypothetical protein
VTEEGQGGGQSRAAHGGWRRQCTEELVEGVMAATWHDIWSGTHEWADQVQE